MWTGYIYETIIKEPMVKEIMKYVDILIDGPFILNKRDISLFLKGSSNQRVIDVQKTREMNKIIIYHE